MSDESSPRSANEVRSFPPFRLDLSEQRLWKHDKQLTLRPKPFSILTYLTAHPRRLVTQEELVEAIWGKWVISESLLRTHVREVRLVLGEGIIETVIGRGYRFARDVETSWPQLTALATDVPGSTEPAPWLVGRDAEMKLAHDVFRDALSGRRQILFVVGEAGIGKSTLVDAFVRHVALPAGALVARGACVDQLGTGEAYLPVFTAMTALCRSARGAHVLEALSRHAPTWLVQMSGLIPDDKLPALQLRVQGATQARLLRELSDALDVLAAERPLLLVLEDLQWSDQSTVDLLAALGSRREAAQLLVIATMRRGEIREDSGARSMMNELRAHRVATTLSIESFTTDAVSDFLARRYGAHRFPRDLPEALTRMTGGNPLFLAALTDDLQGQGLLRESEGTWSLTCSVADVTAQRPETVRQLIDAQIERLKPREQRVLEAASVAGATFAVGAVASALDMANEDVDVICEAQTGDGRLLRYVSADTWPDGSVQSCYAFTHALHRHAALARVPAAISRTWHRRIGEHLERAYAGETDLVAGELAFHFDQAHVLAKASGYYCAAGERASRRFGRADALTQLERAGELVKRLPASDESRRLELRVLERIGPAIVAMQAFREPRLEQMFARTAELGRALGEDRAVLGALLGLQRCLFYRGRLAAIEEHEAEVDLVVGRLQDPVAAAEAAVVSSSARLFRGQLAAAREPLTRAYRVLESAQSDPARVRNGPVVGLAAGHLVTLSWLSGAPDEALAYGASGLAQAEALGDPFQLATALTMLSLAHTWRREPGAALDFAKRAFEVAKDAGSLVWQGRSLTLLHGALVELEPARAEQSLEELTRGLPGPLRTVAYGRTAFLPSFIAVCVRAGQHARALREVDEVLDFVETSDERAWSAELHRVRGDLMESIDPVAALQAHATAAAVAHAQGATSFELRALMSAHRLTRGPARRKDTLESVRRVHSTFREGFSSGDLVEAAAILEVG